MNWRIWLLFPLLLCLGCPQPGTLKVPQTPEQRIAIANATLAQTVKATILGVIEVQKAGFISVDTTRIALGYLESVEKFSLAIARMQDADATWQTLVASIPPLADRKSVV